MRKSRGRIFPLLTITGIVLVAILLWDLSGYSLCHRELSRCGCHKCLTDSDPWFNEIIGEAPKPFLSRKYKLSEDDFSWWKNLQGAKHQNLTLYNQTVDKLFSILTPITDVAEPRPDRCRTCAVVGNSGNLKGSRYGALIDFHDIVIRINYGRTKGYETDVGTRTTHRVMYPESVTKLDNTTHLLFFPFKTRDFLWLYKCLNPGESDFRHSDKIANKDLIMILHPAFIKYVHEVWLGNKGSYPSTGFLTVVLSLFMCDEVTIFGFGADSEGNWSHYFGILRNKQLKTGAHPGQYEYSIIEKLHKKKIITFFKGW
ncbi:CMP-N-acetylneuraminate-beta-galactosamide-alpha-2,3-sialyltransferase 1-like [Archocentrus centrarchus]|uniref:CMP-N-acetylneuraminate-beta-galactosamide- alpha-2,3-sialyltransferase 1-like n=1 Tax=Archocentrus centrarchus TaxID=63155 RepID=UPI0011E9D0CA|nr:CMP-N-acetylneuraminate-beta-galactosamide-alpha-2,3-sialyltransferase 1-like [Archocentrus centrarchus]XP_030597380.1 CMP-N-acetylneuraminate-beta-galactosamide-alpha-2,3-sialyltransferase 1-like [Archocentrus centrarchus]